MATPTEIIILIQKLPVQTGSPPVELRIRIISIMKVAIRIILAPALAILEAIIRIKKIPITSVGLLEPVMLVPTVIPTKEAMDSIRVLLVVLATPIAISEATRIKGTMASVQAVLAILAPRAITSEVVRIKEAVGSLQEPLAILAAIPIISVVAGALREIVSRTQIKGVTVSTLVARIILVAIAISLAEAQVQIL